jgi:flagellar motor switch protein FliM
MQALLSLQVGDTIVLDQRLESPVTIKVAGKSKLYAKAQFDASRKAFAITGYIRPRREESIHGHAVE